MDEVEAKRRTLQETMSFTAALASGVEQLLGRASNGMAFVAGRSLGKEFCAGAKQTTDLQEALGEVKRVLMAKDCRWDFEPFQRKAQAALVTTAPDGAQEIQLVFRDCMIRQSLFRFGHEQQGSLCYTMYGFFSGAIEAIMGCKAELQIVHAGQNACLKRLRITPQG